jgi:hypothetical protein
MTNNAPTMKPTASDLKRLRMQIDRLNMARIELSLAGHLNDNQACDLLDTIDALEDRFIDLTNLRNA